MGVSLRKVTLLDQSAAGTGKEVALDYRFGEDGTQRTVVTTMNAADTVAVQGTVDGGTTWVELFSNTGGTSFINIIVGPWERLRAVKTGAAGAALVCGIV